MLTTDGRLAALGVVAEWLKGARIMVGDGQQRAEAPLDFDPMAFDEGIELTATFEGEMANFEWSERGVVLGDKLIDHEQADGGRKILGAVWTVTYRLDLTAEE